MLIKAYVTLISDMFIGLVHDVVVHLADVVEYVFTTVYD